jgi:hypothetical protein
MSVICQEIKQLRCPTSGLLHACREEAVTLNEIALEMTQIGILPGLH